MQNMILLKKQAYKRYLVVCFLIVILVHQLKD